MRRAAIILLGAVIGAIGLAACAGQSPPRISAGGSPTDGVANDLPAENVIQSQIALPNRDIVFDPPGDARPSVSVDEALKDYESFTFYGTPKDPEVLFGLFTASSYGPVDEQGNVTEPEYVGVPVWLIIQRDIMISPIGPPLKEEQGPHPDDVYGVVDATTGKSIAEFA